MKPSTKQAGLRPATGLRPVPRGGSAPATRENLPLKEELESVVALPLVGPEPYTLFGCLSRPWVTFSFDPTETGLGYIIK
jgi:hypothetical protein